MHWLCWLAFGCRRLFVSSVAATLALVAAAGVASLTAARGNAARRAPRLSTAPAWSVATNGIIDAVARAGDTVYIGGFFSLVGRDTGSGVVVDRLQGKEDPAWPTVSGGPVFVAVSDKHGGWFIGGNFTRVGGLARDGLAHLRADKTVDGAERGETRDS